MTDAQPDLLDWTPPKPLPIGGATYDAASDERRLCAQGIRLFNVMKCGDWFTPEQLEKATGDRWASLSARFRDFRKPEFHVNGKCERESLGDGLFRYRLVMNQ